MKKILICRFGSAFSTVTVLVLDRAVHQAIQHQMNFLEELKQLEEPDLAVGEHVCFKNNQGCWTRARIQAVETVETNGSVDTTVDVMLTDFRSPLKRVDGKAFVAMPATVEQLVSSRFYFIDGLEPYSVLIAPKEGPTTIGAMAFADTINKNWDPTSEDACLVQVTNLSWDNVAHTMQIPVADIRLAARNVLLGSYIRSFLGDQQVYTLPVDSREKTGSMYRSFQSCRHPKYRLLIGPLMPYVSNEELCEIISLQKLSGRLLEVGLCLSSYLDLGLIRETLNKPAKKFLTWKVTPHKLVSISWNSHYMQRGLTLESNVVLGLDTLEVFDFDSGLEFRPLPRFVADVFPRLAFFIEWDVPTELRQPSVGDFVLVKNMKMDPCDEFRYTCDGVSYADTSANIMYRPTRIKKREKQTEATVELPQEGIENDSGKQRKACSPKSLADWYGLSGDLGKFFEKVNPPTDVAVTPEALFCEYGEMA